MKIYHNYIILTIICLILLNSASEAQNLKKSLSVEFENYIKDKPKDEKYHINPYSLLDVIISELQYIMIEGELPVWSELIQNLYSDPDFINSEEIKCAKKILYEKIKSTDIRNVIVGSGLFILIPDTQDVDIISQIAKMNSDKYIELMLYYTLPRIEKKFHQNQYGLLKYFGLTIRTLTLPYLERPIEADKYLTIDIDIEHRLALRDKLIVAEDLYNTIDSLFINNVSICLFIEADQELLWKDLWNIIGPTYKISEKHQKHLTLFFIARPEIDMKIKPYQLGLNFPYKNIRTSAPDIYLELKNNNIFLNGTERELEELSDIFHGKKIKFKVDNNSDVFYVVNIISLFRKYNATEVEYIFK